MKRRNFIAMLPGLAFLPTLLAAKPEPEPYRFMDDGKYYINDNATVKIHRQTEFPSLNGQVKMVIHPNQYDQLLKDWDKSFIDRLFIRSEYLQV